MSNSIFDWPASLKRFVRFTTAKAEDVNDALDGLSAGLDTVEANIARSVKLPVGTADQTIALAAADIFANFFLGGSGICQFDFLRWNYKSDCDTQNFKSCVRVVILLEMRESAKFTRGSGR